MIWVVVFAAWFVAILLWRGYPIMRSAPAGAVSAAVVGIGVSVVFGILAGLVMGLWAWRLPKLAAEMREASRQRRRRDEAFTLIVLLTNGVAGGKPVWTTLRDAQPRLPPMIGAEVKKMVAASRVVSGYDPAQGLEELGEAWNVPELVIAGQISKVATDSVGTGAASAYQGLLDELQARARRYTDLRKGLTEITTTGVIFFSLLAMAILAVLAVPYSRTLYVSTGLGHVVMGIVSLFAVGGLHFTEQVWRRQQASAGAAI